jgi:hypothetical protein
LKSFKAVRDLDRKPPTTPLAADISALLQGVQVAPNIPFVQTEPVGDHPRLDRCSPEDKADVGTVLAIHHLRYVVDEGEIGPHRGPDVFSVFVGQ